MLRIVLWAVFKIIVGRWGHQPIERNKENTHHEEIILRPKLLISASSQRMN
jgi:hypothetical protein